LELHTQLLLGVVVLVVQVMVLLVLQVVIQFLVLLPHLGVVVLVD
jgi:hypothetical protein